jgi:hypothetical protein
MTVLNKLVDAADKLSIRFDKMVESLPIPTEPEAGAFYHIVTAISRTAIKNYSLLREALDTDDQEHLAWACRNLLELDVFMKNILTSKQKMAEFASYRFIDGIQVLERLILLEKKYQREQHILPSGTSQLSARLTEFNRQMNAEGLSQKAHLMTRTWAEPVGMLEEFDIINKVCSKLVHPTVWSVLTEDIGSARFPEAKELFFLYGSTYFSEMFNLLKEHLLQYGPKHKP